jgi:hypothetical protein
MVAMMVVVVVKEENEGRSEEWKEVNEVRERGQ